jgi:hypothetical protein
LMPVWCRLVFFLAQVKFDEVFISNPSSAHGWFMSQRRLLGQVQCRHLEETLGF